MRPLDITAVAAFSEEVRTSTPAILAALDAAEQDPANTDAPHEAYRLIHALKGAASMVGLAALSHLLNAYEDLLDGPVSDQQPLGDDLLALLRSAVPQFPRYVEAALACEPIEPLALELTRACREFSGTNGDDQALIELLEIEQRSLAERHGAAAAAAPPAPAAEPAEELDLVPAEPIPPELAEVFSQEAQEHLQTIARLTSHLSSSPDDREAIQELRRAFHTIKGAAGVVGYKAASRVAHRMEDLLDSLFEGTAALTPEVLRLVAASSDALEDVIAAAADPETLRATVARLFAQYDIVAANTAAPAAVSSQAPSELPAGQAAAATRTAATPPEAARVVERRRGPDRRKSAQDRRGGGAQMVRVPFERLGELVRLVSELVINRSSFDQHFAALVDQVDEVKLSTARLRRVSQRLETDYEVRALASNLTIAPAPGAPGQGGHGFDDLEFDRYTDFHLLSRELTETASDIATVSTRLAETIGNFDGDLTRLGRLTREVQDKVMEFRMVPLASLSSRLERAVRVTAEECGKAVDLVIEGEATALDKRLLEEMTDPLLHLLRNAVDHGIESAAERRAAGKPERGHIAVRALHEGTDVLIEVQDDGGGLDLEKIRRTAVDRGYLAEADAAALGPEDLYALVFEPGFTTASRVSEVSGRGVGLDIVKAKVNQLGGRTHVVSQPHAGTTITIRVPMTLAITRILLVRAGGETMGLPLGAVVQIVRPDAASVSMVGSERVLTIDGRTYPLRDLAETLALPHSSETAAAVQPVLIANLGGRKLALAVDEIMQSRDAVVKTLGTHLRRVQGVWGATLLGDGTVILILNPADLAGADETRARGPVARITPRVVSERDAYNVLVVDDSLSMRHVLSNAVKKAGWNPLQARDGVEALEIVHRGATPPDVILLDIEMPRMDGYEFLSTLRAQDVYRDLPIVMLTSRGGEKHREKALSLGATDYVVKPFQEEALLQKLGDLVRAARGRERKAAS